MKTLFFSILLVCSIITILEAQIDFTEHTISNLTDRARSVYTIDIDGDGDLDVVSASSGDGKIAWYENENGQGAFGEQQIITDGLSGARTVFGADIDGDGDSDVIAASCGEGIAWHTNLDGQGSFGAAQVVDSTSCYIGPRSIYAIDLDGDNDLDIVAANLSDGIFWFENVDGQGTFSERMAIHTGEEGSASAIYAADIDGDGDHDVLSTYGSLMSAESNKVFWYENINGEGLFDTPQVISNEIQNSYCVIATDIDGDDDMDVISCTRIPFLDGSANVSWFENTDGQGTFTANQIDDEFDAIYVYPSDLDGDNDLDLIVAGSGVGRLAWYDNIDGNGTFSEKQFFSELTKPWIIDAADIDGDGDNDVITASDAEDRVVWFENLNPTSVLEPGKLTFELFPSPAQNRLSIKTETFIDQVEIWDQFGRLILSIDHYDTSIDISSLTEGVYFCKVFDSTKKFKIKRFLKS